MHGHSAGPLNGTKNTNKVKACVSHEGHGQFKGAYITRRTSTVLRCVCHMKDTDSFKVCVSHEGHGQFKGVCVTRGTRTV
jgi:hypothetical protein